jgi:hypothetical protein
MKLVHVLLIASAVQSIKIQKAFEEPMDSYLALNNNTDAEPVDAESAEKKEEPVNSEAKAATPVPATQPVFPAASVPALAAVKNASPVILAAKPSVVKTETENPDLPSGETARLNPGGKLELVDSKRAKVSPTMDTNSGFQLD